MKKEILECNNNMINDAIFIRPTFSRAFGSVSGLYAIFFTVISCIFFAMLIALPYIDPKYFNIKISIITANMLLLLIIIIRIIKVKKILKKGVPIYGKIIELNWVSADDRHASSGDEVKAEYFIYGKKYFFRFFDDVRSKNSYHINGNVFLLVDLNNPKNVIHVDNNEKLRRSNFLWPKI